MTTKELAKLLVDLELVNSATAGKEIVDAIIDSICATLHSEEEVFLAGLGRLYLAETKARTGRNPKTGESIQIPARKVLKFRPVGSFKK